MMNLPNILTFIRIGIIPFFILAFYLPGWWGHLIAATLFAFASITDWLDGYLARSLKLSTKLGAFLDPVADKLMVSIALVLIVGQPQFQFITLSSAVYSVPVPVITLPAAVIVSREIIVSALREWMAELGQRRSIAVSHLGKVKTAVQMIAVTILIYSNPTTSALVAITGYALLYIAAFLTIWSMVLYLKIAMPELLK